MLILQKRSLRIFSFALSTSLIVIPLESSSQTNQESFPLTKDAKDVLNPRISQVFKPDWSIVKVRESSFVVKLKPNALERLMKKAAEMGKEKLEEAPGSIETIINWANESFRNIPDASGTISISFLPPPLENLNDQTRKELRDAFETSPFVLKMDSPVWEVKASFSSLPTQEAVKEAIDALEKEIKERNIFPDSVSKSSLKSAWNFAKAVIKEVELIIHLKV